MFLRAALCLILCGCGSKPATTNAAPNTNPIDNTPAKSPVVSTAGLPALDRDPKASTKCGKLDASSFTRLPVLAERIAIQAPKGMQSLARAYNIMSSPKPPEEEERLMLGGGQSAGAAPGDDAFVVLARETWQLDPDRAAAEPDAIVHPGKMADEAPNFMKAVFAPDLDIQQVALTDPTIRAWVGRPPKPAAEPGADAALVLALVIALPDATLQMVSFHVTPDLAADAGCMHLAERMGMSLTVGKRALERAAGSRALGKLKIDAPEDYVVVYQPGPDFDVFTLYLLRPLSLYPGEIVVMVDGEAGPAEGKVLAKGKLLGKQVTWLGERTAKGGHMMATVDTGKREKVHVQLIATRQDKYLDAFRAVAETLSR